MDKIENLIQNLAHWELGAERANENLIFLKLIGGEGIRFRATRKGHIQVESCEGYQLICFHPNNFNELKEFFKKGNEFFNG